MADHTDHKLTRYTLRWTELGSVDAVFVHRAGGASPFLHDLLNTRGEEHFTPILRGALHRSLQRSAWGKARQVNPIDVSKTVGLRGGWNDVMAGATPPFDAPRVTDFVGPLPPLSRAARDASWPRSYTGASIFECGQQYNRSERKERGPVAVLKSRAERHCQRSSFQVKNVRITSCTFRPANFFTRRSAYGVCSQRFATTAPAKVTTQNRPKRAGATPLFGGRSAQKFGRVAPALVGTSRQRVLRGRVGQPREFVRQHV